jgi:hypothetical protein
LVILRFQCKFYLSAIQYKEKVAGWLEIRDEMQQGEMNDNPDYALI